jgi:hypothetical protein
MTSGNPLPCRLPFLGGCRSGFRVLPSLAVHRITETQVDTLLDRPVMSPEVATARRIAPRRHERLALQGPRDLC